MILVCKQIDEIDAKCITHKLREKESFKVMLVKLYCITNYK